MTRRSRLPALLPRDFDRWNRAIRGAYLKGRRAYDEGVDASACPYVDRRTCGGKITWARAFIRAWDDGFKDGERVQNGDLRSFGEGAG